MGKALDNYKKYLEERVANIDNLASDNIKAKQDADEAQALAYAKADESFSKAIADIETNGIALQELAMAEIDEENNASKNSEKLKKIK